MMFSKGHLFILPFTFFLVTVEPTAHFDYFQLVIILLDFGCFGLPRFHPLERSARARWTRSSSGRSLRNLLSLRRSRSRVLTRTLRRREFHAVKPGGRMGHGTDALMSRVSPVSRLLEECTCFACFALLRFASPGDDTRSEDLDSQSFSNLMLKARYSSMERSGFSLKCIVQRIRRSPKKKRQNQASDG